MVFLVISVDTAENSAKLWSMRDAKDKTVFLEDAYSSDYTKMAFWQFGNIGTPTMYVVGADGRMASRLIQDTSLTHVIERIEWARAAIRPASEP